MKHPYALSLPENLLQGKQPKSLGSVVPAFCREFRLPEPGLVLQILVNFTLKKTSNSRGIHFRTSSRAQPLYSHIFSGSRFGMSTGRLTLAQQGFFRMCFNRTFWDSRTAWAYTCVYILLLSIMLCEPKSISLNSWCFILWSLQRYPGRCKVQQGHGDKGHSTGMNWAGLFYPNPQSVVVLFYDNNVLAPIGSVLHGSTTWPQVTAQTVCGTMETPGRFPESTLDGMADFYSHHVTSLTDKPPHHLLLRFFVPSHEFLCISRWCSPSQEHAESQCLYLLPVHRRHKLQTGWPWGWTFPFVLPFAACASLYAPCPCLQTSPPGLKRLPAAQETKGDTQGMSLMHTSSSIHTSGTGLVEWDPGADVFHAALSGSEFWPLQEGESIRK